MRRTTAMLAVCTCALTGCQGGGAQEPYDGVIAASRSPVTAAVPAPQASEAEAIDSEVDVPWTIALLSDGKAPTMKKAGRVIVVDAEPDGPDPIAREADLHVAVDPEPTTEKPATPKTCSGVVKSRS
jgi:hypothetical protein